MKITDKIIKKIIAEEGFREEIYQDVAGVDTIGYGFTKFKLDGTRGLPKIDKFKKGKIMTEEEALGYLKIILEEDLNAIKNEINNEEQFNKLNEDQIVALLDLTYRNGVGNMRETNIFNLIREDKFNEISEEIINNENLTKAGGVQTDNKGIINRTNTNSEAFKSQTNNKNVNLSSSVIIDENTQITDFDKIPENETEYQKYIRLSLKQKFALNNNLNEVLTGPEIIFLSDVQEAKTDLTPEQVVAANLVISENGDGAFLENPEAYAYEDAMKFATGLATGNAKKGFDVVTDGATTAAPEVQRNIEKQKALDNINKEKKQLEEPKEKAKQEEKENELTETTKDKQEIILEEIDDIETKEEKTKKVRQEKFKEKLPELTEGLLTGLKAAAGAISLSKALKNNIVKTELSPLLQEALTKQKELSKSGLTAEEKAAAMKNINDGYAGAMKNVLRASGGQRGAYLANQGVVDANRVSSLIDLAGKDAAIRRQNIGQYNQLATAVGKMQLQADLSNEQLRQQTVVQNRNILGNLSTNLLSSALDDASAYLNPNTKAISSLVNSTIKTIQERNVGNTTEGFDTDLNIEPK